MRFLDVFLEAFCTEPKHRLIVERAALRGWLAARFALDYVRWAHPICLATAASFSFLPARSATELTSHRIAARTVSRAGVKAAAFGLPWSR